jgi:hypothetical protein
MSLPRSSPCSVGSMLPGKEIGGLETALPERVGGWRFQRLGPVMPVAMVALVLFIPCHHTQHNSNRDLLESYRRLAAFEEIVQRPKTGLLV